MTDEVIVIYEEQTGLVDAMKMGEYWVLPESQRVYSGTFEDVENHISYNDEGRALFIIQDSNAS